MKIRVIVLSLLILGLIYRSCSIELPDRLKLFQNEFSDKVAFVTGGTSGIGYNIALSLAQLGAKVVFIARDAHPSWFNGLKAQTAIRSDPLVKQNKGNATFYQADITNNTQIKAAIHYTHYSLKKIDFFVNCAGILGWFNRTDLITDDMLLMEHDPIYVNLYGTLNMLRAESRYLLDYGNPNRTHYSIVNFASYNGLRGCQNCSLYSASKHAIIGLTQSMALEYALSKPLIRVNAIAPGLVNTSLTWQQVKTFEYGEPNWFEPYIDSQNPLWLKYEPSIVSKLPASQISQPQEQADTALFLLSSLSSYCNGQVWAVDLTATTY